jgi:hypothetical protein
LKSRIVIAMSKNIADDIEQFENRWEAHIDELEKLGMSLPAENISELQDVKRDLYNLLLIAVENMEDDL